MDKYVKVYNTMINDMNRTPLCCCLQSEYSSKIVYYGMGNDPLLDKIILDAYNHITNMNIRSVLSEIIIECSRYFEPNIKPGYVGCSYLFDNYGTNNIIIIDDIIPPHGNYNERCITLYFWKL
jgi:hypothetical protein